VSDDGMVSSLKYLFADFLDEEDTTPPFLPDGLPEAAASIVSEAIHLLMDYQGATYARLYVERLTRFIGKGLPAKTYCEMARLMARRMAYEDAIRIAQLKLAEHRHSDGQIISTEVRQFRLDELVDALPGIAADPVLTMLDKIGWSHRRVSIPFSTASQWSIRRLRLEASLRRWRMFSIRYSRERNWVERWLHMTARSMVKQPEATDAIVATATMVQGYGDAYRQGLADWHAIIDGLVKPTFDGVLPLADLAGAITEARSATIPDPRQVSLKRAIARIRARATAPDAHAAAG
jgi:uncharacterized protein DUF6537